MKKQFNKFSSLITSFIGNPITFIAVLLLLAGLIAFNKWEIIDRSATVIPFLIIFIFQYSQNRDTKAINLKVDELIKVTEARNELQGIEKLDEDEIKELK